MAIISSELVAAAAVWARRTARPACLALCPTSSPPAPLGIALACFDYQPFSLPSILELLYSLFYS